MSRLIVTDLTRFKNKEILCMAGLMQGDATCVRPARAFTGQGPTYYRYDDLRRLNVLPGTILEGEFGFPAQMHAPHVEDRVPQGRLTVVGAATSEEFETALAQSAYESLSAGFGVELKGDKKYLATLQPPTRSIITLRTSPANFSVFEDKYGKLRTHVMDGTGTRYQYLSVTDLGFFDYVGNTNTRRMTAAEALAQIHAQTSLYLRIGLSRIHEGCYWLQVNGIYTFPDYSIILRQY